MRFCLRNTALLVLFTFTSFVDSYARNHVVTIRGGEVHLRGALAEGGCEVSTESREMQIDMGQYRTDSFDGVGSLSTPAIPFSIHLTDCNPSLANEVGISFYGMTDQKEPDVFLVTSCDASQAAISGGEGSSGLGLVLYDKAGHQLIPDTLTDLTAPVQAREVVMNYIARYRVTSRETLPGTLCSEVWFRLEYP